MRREGISTPTHPSYSTGSTLKRIEERLLNTAQKNARTLEGNTDGKRGGNGLARISHPMPTYLIWNEN